MGMMPLGASNAGLAGLVGGLGNAFTAYNQTKAAQQEAVMKQQEFASQQMLREAQMMEIHNKIESTKVHMDNVGSALDAYYSLPEDVKDVGKSILKDNLKTLFEDAASDPMRAAYLRQQMQGISQKLPDQTGPQPQGPSTGSYAMGQQALSDNAGVGGYGSPSEMPATWYPPMAKPNAVEYQDMVQREGGWHPPMAASNNGRAIKQVMEQNRRPIPAQAMAPAPVEVAPVMPAQEPAPMPTPQQAAQVAQKVARGIVLNQAEAQLFQHLVASRANQQIGMAKISSAEEIAALKNKEFMAGLEAKINSAKSLEELKRDLGKLQYGTQLQIAQGHDQAGVDRAKIGAEARVKAAQIGASKKAGAGKPEKIDPVVGRLAQKAFDAFNPTGFSMASPKEKAQAAVTFYSMVEQNPSLKAAFPNMEQALAPYKKYIDLYKAQSGKSSGVSVEQSIPELKSADEFKALEDGKKFTKDGVKYVKKNGVAIKVK